jgi:hypothetical protein
MNSRQSCASFYNRVDKHVARSEERLFNALLALHDADPNSIDWIRTAPKYHGWFDADEFIHAVYAHIAELKAK